VTLNGTAYTFAGQGSAAKGVVSVGAATLERQIINVAAGNISASSTDAINGSQLYATNQAVTAIAASQTHYYSVKSTNVAAGSNYNNDGATGTNALAAGVSATASGNGSVAIGTSNTSTGNKVATTAPDGTVVRELNYELQFLKRFELRA
jgi:autotransporter adhesin